MTNNRIEELNKLLKHYSDQYYNEGNSDVSDLEFDGLVKEYEKLTGEKYKSETAPKKGKKLVDVSHKFPNLVGTLDKAFDVEELFVWWEDLGKLHNKNILITPKYDGNSVVVSFNKDGKLIQALTRGKEGKGLDLTAFFSDVTLYSGSDILKDLKEDEIVGIKCEALITYENFEKISEMEGKSYANPRNMVAGILNSLDGDKYKEYVSLAPIDYTIYNEKTKESYNPTIRTERIDALMHSFRNNMFSNAIMLPYISKTELTKDFMETVYSTYIESRNDLPVMIDGLVIELTNDNVRNKLGRSGDRNNFDIALKFPYMTADTIVEDIQWYIGKTGRFTPVAKVKPVYFNGAEIVNISLSNIDRFKKLNLYKGCPVIVGYRADVMAYLDVKEHVSSRINGKEYFEIPTHCPKCGSLLELNENGTFLFCSNMDCKCNVVGKIVNWFTKLDIKGIKESTVEKMVDYMDEKYNDASILRLYSLTKDDLLSIEGFKEKSADNIIEAIHSKKEIYDYQLFGSLHFKNVGLRTSKDIFSKYEYYEITKEKLMEVEGVSEILAENFINGMEANKKILNEFLSGESHIIIKSYKRTLNTIKVGGELPKIIVFTGFRDKELQESIELKGSKVTSSVSKKTELVITKDVNGSSSKLKKAREAGIPIITPEEFKNKYIL